MTAGSKLVSATIKRVWNETPNVKGLQLAVDAAGSLNFQPGQWVDFHAPGVQHVGGYSICSTPQDLQRCGTFDLCVKASRHPCAQWVHQQAAPGNKVSVQVGGTFTLAPSSRTRPTLFIAGGIGITCMSSMLGHLVELEEQEQQMGQQAKAHTPAPLLMYSAASPEEFALLPRLLDWHQRGFLRLQLHTTQSHGLTAYLQHNMQQQLPQQHPAAAHQQQPLLQEGRIDRAHLQQAVRQLQQASQGVDAYVCGPPKMTDAVVELLQQLGLDSNCIRTEKWW